MICCKPRRNKDWSKAGFSNTSQEKKEKKHTARCFETDGDGRLLARASQCLKSTRITHPCAHFLQRRLNQQSFDRPWEPRSRVPGPNICQRKGPPRRLSFGATSDPVELLTLRPFQWGYHKIRNSFYHKKMLHSQKPQVKVLLLFLSFFFLFASVENKKMILIYFGLKTFVCVCLYKFPCWENFFRTFDCFQGVGIDRGWGFRGGGIWVGSREI